MGWRSYSRLQWFKRDGTVVQFLSLIDQLEVVAAGKTVHLVGKADKPLRNYQAAASHCHHL